MIFLQFRGINTVQYSACVHINVVSCCFPHLAFESSKIIFSSSMGDGVRISTPQAHGQLNAINDR